MKGYMMEAPSHADAFEVLCLQAADEGRGEILFGDSFQCARKAVRPFIVGGEFPSVYLEFPLAGNPFMDVTVLYSELAPGTRIDSAAAEATEDLLDWYAKACSEIEGVCCGFELDTKETSLPAAAVHFQPRTHVELVKPFCEAAGDPHRADLYLDLAGRMPNGWDLSFFGMFRGRPDSPLRVCGYLSREAAERCIQDSRELARVFDTVGFSAYDGAMVSQVRMLMEAAPGDIDFQFDVFPDGGISDVFAIDVQFEIAQPEAVRGSFSSGPVARVMGLLQEWGAADDRWKLGGDSAFARAIGVELPDGNRGRYRFALMPQWAKARWRGTELQPSKLYLLGNAGITE